VELKPLEIGRGGRESPGNEFVRTDDVINCN